jgi:hypothetical protein
MVSKAGALSVGIAEHFCQKKTYKKTFFFNFFLDTFYVVVELTIISDFTDFTFSNNSVLNFVWIYCAHPVDLKK